MCIYKAVESFSKTIESFIRSLTGTPPGRFVKFAQMNSLTYFVRAQLEMKTTRVDLYKFGHGPEIMSLKYVDHRSIVHISHISLVKTTIFLFTLNIFPLTRFITIITIVTYTMGNNRIQMFGMSY